MGGEVGYGHCVAIVRVVIRVKGVDELLEVTVEW